MLNDAEWTYHSPTEETLPKYEAIRKAEGRVSMLIEQFYDLDVAGPTYAEINACVKEFAQVIDDLAPNSADKTAAIRCCRLVRNALNEARREKELSILVEEVSQHQDTCIKVAHVEALKARWQANAAIAIAAAQNS